MHGAWRGVPGNSVRRQDGSSTSSERSRTSTSSDDSGHVRERVIHYRRFGYSRARRAQRIWRTVSGIWTPAVGRTRAANSRPLSQRSPRQRIYGARPQVLQQQNTRRTVYEVIILFFYIKVFLTTNKKRMISNIKYINIKMSIC